MERNIIVIDDFYDDPDEVRNFGLTAEYPDPGEGYTYPGKNSRLGFYNDDTHKKMESIVGAGLEPSDPCGYFRISLEHDSLKQDVHVDPGWDWGGVLYVNTPEQCIDEGGTSFWKHKSLHWERSTNSRRITILFLPYIQRSMEHHSIWCRVRSKSVDKIYVMSNEI